MGEEMNQRVLPYPTVETQCHFIDRRVVLVTHTAGGGERVVYEAEECREAEIEERVSEGERDGREEGGEEAEMNLWIMIERWLEAGSRKVSARIT